MGKSIKFKVIGDGKTHFELENGVVIKSEGFIKNKKVFDEKTGTQTFYYIGSDGNEYEVVNVLVGDYYRVSKISLVEKE